MAWYGTDRAVKLTTDLTRYHEHLVVGTTGHLLHGVKVGEWGYTDRFGAVRFDCCGAMLDILLDSLDIEESTENAATEQAPAEPKTSDVTSNAPSGTQAAETPAYVPLRYQPTKQRDSKLKWRLDYLTVVQLIVRFLTPSHVLGTDYQRIAMVLNGGSTGIPGFPPGFVIRPPAGYGTRTVPRKWTGPSVKTLLGHNDIERSLHRVYLAWERSGKCTSDPYFDNGIGPNARRAARRFFKDEKEARLALKILGNRN